MKAEDIHDAESLKAWLEALPDAVRPLDPIWIAFRAAARVYPIYGRQVDAFDAFQDSQRDLTGLALLRRLLVAGVAAVISTREVAEAAFAATKAEFLTGGADIDAAAAAVAFTAFAATAIDDSDPIFVADSVVYDKTEVDAALDAAEAAGSAVHIFADAAAAGVLWREIQRDAVVLEGEREGPLPSLWSEVPGWFGRAQAEMLAIWDAAPAGVWDFWRRWWDGVVTGQPLPWGLQEKVALIDNAIWKQGARAVAEEIARIEAEFALTLKMQQISLENPSALVVVYEATRKGLVCRPAEQVDLEGICQQVTVALGDFSSRCKASAGANLLGASMLSVVSPVARDIRRDLKRYRQEPLMLFDALNAACAELASLGKDQGFSSDSSFQRLAGRIAQLADDICIASPQVLEHQKARMAVKIAKMDDRLMQLAIDGLRGMEADSLDLLKVILGAALRSLTDPQASPKEKAAALHTVYALGSRGALAVLEKKPDPKQGLGEGVMDVLDVVDKVNKGTTAIGSMAEKSASWASTLGELFGSMPSTF